VGHGAKEIIVNLPDRFICLEGNFWLYFLDNLPINSVAAFEVFLERTKLILRHIAISIPIRLNSFSVAKGH